MIEKVEDRLRQDRKRGKDRVIKGRVRRDPRRPGKEGRDA